MKSLVVHVDISRSKHEYCENLESHDVLWLVYQFIIMGIQPTSMVSGWWSRFALRISVFLQLGVTWLKGVNPDDINHWIPLAYSYQPFLTSSTIVRHYLPYLTTINHYSPPCSIVIIPIMINHYQPLSMKPLPLWLVGGFKHYLFSIIYWIILPID